MKNFLLKISFLCFIVLLVSCVYLPFSSDYRNSLRAKEILNDGLKYCDEAIDSLKKFKKTSDTAYFAIRKYRHYQRKKSSAQHYDKNVAPVNGESSLSNRVRRCETLAGGILAERRLKRERGKQAYREKLLKEREREQKERDAAPISKERRAFLMKLSRYKDTLGCITKREADEYRLIMRGVFFPFSWKLNQLVDGWAIYINDDLSDITESDAGYACKLEHNRHKEACIQMENYRYIIAVKQTTLKGGLSHGNRLFSQAHCLGRLEDTEGTNLSGFPIKIRRYEAMYP